MSSIHSLAAALFGSVLVGCGGGALTQAGTQVRLLKGDVPSTCKEVGSVSGYTIGPDYQERNKNKLRNAAAEKNGNVVRLEQNDSDGNASGTAYRCPGDIGASAAPPAK